MNVTFVVALWAVLGIATLILAIYRQLLSVHKESDVVHLGAGEEKEIPRQVSLARKMNVIDSWGKTMTVVTAVIGLGLATAYLYQAWESPNPGPNNFYRNNSPVK
ncbi:MAG: hypothetical protein ABI833_16365 [Acidobacteriota bacterium]